MVYSMEVRSMAPTGTPPAEAPDTMPKTLLVPCSDCGAQEQVPCPDGKDHPERIQLAYHSGLL